MYVSTASSHNLHFSHFKILEDWVTWAHLEFLNDDRTSCDIFESCKSLLNHHKFILPTVLYGNVQPLAMGKICKNIILSYYCSYYTFYDKIYVLNYVRMM